jgi:hypothetical protein
VGWRGCETHAAFLGRRGDDFKMIPNSGVRVLTVRDDRL